MLFEPARFAPIPPELRWRYRQIPRGGELLAWLIGPVVPVVVHWSKHSDPCRRALTGGALPCPACELKQAKRTIGYVPLLTPQRERVVIIASATVGMELEQVAHATPLKFWRRDAKCVPLQFSMSSDSKFTPAASQNIAQRPPCDLTPWLLHLWGDDELGTWLMEHKRSSEHNSRPGSAETPTQSVIDPPKAARDDVVSLKTPLIRRPRKKDSA